MTHLMTRNSLVKKNIHHTPPQLERPTQRENLWAGALADSVSSGEIFDNSAEPLQSRGSGNQSWQVEAMSLGLSLVNWDSAEQVE